MFFSTEISHDRGSVNHEVWIKLNHDQDKVCMYINIPTQTKVYDKLIASTNGSFMKSMVRMNVTEYILRFT